MTDLAADNGLVDMINDMLIVQEDTKTIVMFFDFSMCQSWDMQTVLGDLADRYKNCIRFGEASKGDSPELFESLSIRKPNTCVTYTNGEEDHRSSIERHISTWSSVLAL